MQLSASNSCQKSVAIVGAGAAGLAAVSILRRSCRVTVFERSADFVGGVWNYREAPEAGPMYSLLRTNLPKEIMAFPDWQWREPETSFVAHETVLEYLNSYCYGQGLESFIRFGHEVVSVRRRQVQEARSGTAGNVAAAWIVETHQSGAQAFDAVVLANGHFAKPLTPQLPGVEKVPTPMISHSCTYRCAEKFKDKVVALLGAGSSGQDIALELASSAKHVYLCHRGPRLQSKLPGNLTQLGPIDGIQCDDEVQSGDSSACCILLNSHNGPVRLQVDHVMFCTGYDYDFPFLANELRGAAKPSHVPCLYMHVAHCQLPGLYFLGLCTQVVPFPQFYLQAKLIEAMLLGRLQLPTDAAATSLRDEAEKLAMGVTDRHLHTLGDDQWAYNDHLADLAGCPRLPPVMRLIYDDVKLERKLRLVDYKRWGYRITGVDTFERRLLG